MNITNSKPKNIKEYKKNYKFHGNQKNKEKENLNQSQNILLYKILKNKNINLNISMDSSINKTIENTIQKEENKKKVLNYLKNKNNHISKSSYIISPSDNHEHGSSSTFLDENSKKHLNKEGNCDSFLGNKNFNNNNNKTTTNSKKRVINQYKAITPYGNYKKKKI